MILIYLNLLHYYNIVICKASKMIGIIYCTFHVFTLYNFRTLYTASVRPHLDCACVVWQPYLLKDIRLSEAVNLTYTDRPKSLNLPSLFYRRMDTIMTYKILHGLVDVPRDEFFTFNTCSTRSSVLKLLKLYVKTNLRLNSFSIKVINEWNSLPSDIVQATSVTTFKTLLHVASYTGTII